MWGRRRRLRLRRPRQRPADRHGAEPPHAGAIELRDMRMGYREGLPDVLKGCALSVRGGEKIAMLRRGVRRATNHAAVFEDIGKVCIVDFVEQFLCRLQFVKAIRSVSPQVASEFFVPRIQHFHSVLLRNLPQILVL